MSSEIAIVDSSIEQLPPTAARSGVSITSEIGSHAGAIRGKDGVDWWPVAVQQFDRIASLSPGWDSDGAFSPSRSLVLSSLSLLGSLWQAEWFPKPHITPTRAGGIQFEWEDHGRYFEVEIVGERAATYLFQDAVTGIEYEGEIFEKENLAPILECIRRISEP